MKNDNGAVRFSWAKKTGLALVAVLALGLVASAARAQTGGGISLPGLFKDAMKQRQPEVPSKASANEVKEGSIAQQPGATSAAQAKEVKGNTADQQGTPSAARGAQGEIVFPGKTLSGAFMHDPGNEAYKSTIFGKFFCCGSVDIFDVKAFDENGSLVLEMKFEDSLANLAKTPRTYTFRGRKGKPETAEILYQNVGIVCKTSAGTLTVTAFGGVDGDVIGKMTGLEWYQPECATALGTSASFKVQRAVDYQPR